jgi:hypothetical protein
MQNLVKWVAVLTLVAGLLMLGGIACGGDEEATPTPTATETATPTPAQLEAYKVGAIFSTTRQMLRNALRWPTGSSSRTRCWP